jgi:hypothetical protein
MTQEMNPKLDCFCSECDDFVGLAGEIRTRCYCDREKVQREFDEKFEETSKSLDLGANCFECGLNMRPSDGSCVGDELYCKDCYVDHSDLEDDFEDQLDPTMRLIVNDLGRKNGIEFAPNATVKEMTLEVLKKMLNL